MGVGRFNSWASLIEETAAVDLAVLMFGLPIFLWAKLPPTTSLQFASSFFRAGRRLHDSGSSCPGPVVMTMGAVGGARRSCGHDNHGATERYRACLLIRRSPVGAGAEDFHRQSGEQSR